MKSRDKNFVPTSFRSAEEYDEDERYHRDLAQHGAFYAMIRPLREMLSEVAESYGGVSKCLFSDREYCQLIGSALRNFDLALDGIEQGDANRAATHALRAGIAMEASSLFALHEEDAWRGEVTKLSAKAGGGLRRGKLGASTNSVLDEMERQRSLGRSRSQAAMVAFSKGHGESKAANEKLWYRHRGSWQGADKT